MADGAGSKVVLYTSADQEFAQGIVASFTAKTGIRVAARYDTEATKTLGLVQRLRHEARRPQADVFWSSEIFETIRLANEGLLASYESETLADWPTQLRDQQGRWYGFALRGRVIGYNRNRVDAKDVPASIEDLLQQRWKGRLVMARPQFGTTRGHVAAMLTHYGPQRYRTIIDGLKANQVTLASGNSSAVRMVAEGRADICLTDTDDVWVAQRNNWPVGLVYPMHGKSGTLLIPNTVALVKDSPHPAHAATLLEFLLSAEVEEMLAMSDSHNLPIREHLAARFPQYAVKNPMIIDYAQVASNVNDAVRIATKGLE